MRHAEKLAVLSRIGQRFYDAHRTWAAGTSLPLYFKARTEEFLMAHGGCRKLPKAAAGAGC